MEGTQSDAMTPTKLGSTQTTLGELCHDLLDFGWASPPLHRNVCCPIHPCSLTRSGAV
jgi:hypothetical protein